MTEFVILSRYDMLVLCEDKPVTIWIDGKPYVLCTDEYFEKQKGNTQADFPQAKDIEPTVENFSKVLDNKLIRDAIRDCEKR